MAVRRTTVAADPDDLRVLEAEARRRGVSLSLVLREAVARRAAELRSGRAPRFGIGSGDGSLSQDSVEDEDSPAVGRGRD